MSRLPLLVAAAAVVLVVACDVSTQPQLAVFGVRTGSSNSTLVISPSSAQIIVGGVIQLSTSAPLDSQNVLQWSSSQPTIAAVTPAGLVQGISVGTATITVRYSSDTTTFATAAIKVNAVPGTATRIP
jgi:uncharacterized protein YjdB